MRLLSASASTHEFTNEGIGVNATALAIQSADHRAAHESKTAGVDGISAIRGRVLRAGIRTTVVFAATDVDTLNRSVGWRNASLSGRPLVDLPTVGFAPTATQPRAVLIARRLVPIATFEFTARRLREPQEHPAL